MAMNKKPIIRLEKKLKSLSQIRESVRYTRRGVVAQAIDPEMKVGRLYGSDDPYGDAKAMLSSVNNIRANAVHAIEFVMTASPAYFRENAHAWGEFEEVKLHAFLKAAVDWAKEYFSDNLISITLHLDQATPHVHALVVPMLDGKLNCRELYSLRARLKKLQVSYAKAMAPLGLERGSPQVGAKHTERGKWIAESEAKLSKRTSELEEREKAVQSEREALTKFDEKLQTRKGKLVKARVILQERNTATIKKERELEHMTTALRADAEGLSDDAEYFRQLISELEELKANVPAQLAEEGRLLVEKFGI